MRYWLSAAMLACVAACNAPADEEAGPKAGDPGTYSRNLGDGTPVALVIREDGSILRTSGKQATTGTARRDGDRLCFTFADDDGGEYCWTNGPIRPGGTFESTSDDGEVLIITYTPEVPPRGYEMVPGLYETGDETTVYGQTQVNADGTYVDLADGEPVGGGKWTANGERACFDPDGDEDHQKARCWISAPLQEDGRFISRREDGSQAYFVKPIME